MMLLNKKCILIKTFFAFIIFIFDKGRKELVSKLIKFNKYLIKLCTYALK